MRQNKFFVIPRICVANSRGIQLDHPRIFLWKTRVMTIFPILLLFTFDTYAQEAQAPANPVVAYALVQADVETAAAKQLVEKGAAQRVRVMLQGNRSNILYEATRPVTPKLTGLNFSKNTSRWTANLLVLSGDEVITAMPVGGRYDEMVLRPVLKRQVQGGELISEADIDEMEFPIANTRNDEVLDAKKLVGMGPRTVISPHRPIRGSEITSPALVHKNTVVTMHFNGGGIDITTSGQVLTDGGKGDVVEVKNLMSKNVVRARVEDAYTVNVSPPSRQQLAGVPYVPAN